MVRVSQDDWHIKALKYAFSLGDLVKILVCFLGDLRAILRITGVYDIPPPPMLEKIPE